MDVGLEIAVRLLIAAYVGVGVWLSVIVVQKAGFGWWWGIVPWLPSIFWMFPGIEIVGVLAAPVPLIFAYIFAFIAWPLDRYRTVHHPAVPPPGADPDDFAPTQKGAAVPAAAMQNFDDMQPTSWLLTGFDEAGRVVRLELPDEDLATRRDGFVIGRSPQSSELLIADDSVSRRHARVFLRGGRLSIEDLGSANGTNVGGAVLQPHEPSTIDKGDTVEVGAVRLTVSRG
jgi:pSer/pThr/pTyr-binding forkhead associated (FHA) protein